MTTIGEKIFSYIDIAGDLTQSMVDQYRNSLIFLGDERQIFQPLTGAYVGIGMTYFNEVKEELKNNTELLKHLDEHIHQNVVNSIYANFSAEEFDNRFDPVNADALTPQMISGHLLGFAETAYLMTNQDIVLRGLFDYDPSTGLARRQDELGIRYDEGINEQLWAHIDRPIVTFNAPGGTLKTVTYASSGIQVNVHHTNEYKEGYDSYQFHYSYWEGHDYLTIDDSLTWAYISNRVSYAMSFSKAIAVDQANRVYHDILGGNDPVYIEKGFDEVFEINEYSDLVPINPDTLGEIYIHLDKTQINENRDEWDPVYIYNDDTNGYYYIYARIQDVSSNSIDELFNYVIDTNDPNFTTAKTIIDANNNTFDIKPITQQDLIRYLNKDDGYDKKTVNGEVVFDKVNWYHVDYELTAQGQMNLADGIQTLREVAYILDRITDGSQDDVITITYNIAQNAIDIAYFKNKWANIGDFVPTSIAGSSSSDFVIVNSYSMDKWNIQTPEAPVGMDTPAKGDARLDVDLKLARTYYLTFEVGTPDEYRMAYAAYLSSEHSNYLAPVWKYMGDQTSTNYWYHIADDIPNLQSFVEKYKQATGQNEIVIYNKIILENGIDFQVSTTIPIGSLSSYPYSSDDDMDYVFFPYEEVTPVVHDGIIDGLTTVGWVTTYFNWAQVDIFNEVNRLDNEVKEWVISYINSMNVDDVDYAGQFVSRVRQVNGRISVEHKKLPLDTILASQEIYGNDFWVPISSDYALELIGDDPTDQTMLNRIYYLDNNVFRHPTSFDPLLQYYILGNTTRFTSILSNTDLPDLSISTSPKAITDVLLLNEGKFTYFQKSVVNRYEENVGNTIVTEDSLMFNPVDINELITKSTEFIVDPETSLVTYYLSSTVLSSLYYYDGSSNPIAKYFEAFTRQNRDDGHTEIFVTSYVTPLGASTKNNRGLADSYDVRHTIETMFSWINLKTNQIIDKDHPATIQIAETETEPEP